MKAILTVETVKMDMAAGQVLTDWSFVVSANGALVERQDVPSPSAEFDLPPGDYTATAQRFDSTGAAFGGAASVAFTIPADVTAATAPVDPAAAAIVQGDAANTLSFTLS